MDYTLGVMKSTDKSKKSSKFIKKSQRKSHLVAPKTVELRGFC